MSMARNPRTTSNFRPASAGDALGAGMLVVLLASMALGALVVVALVVLAVVDVFV